MHLFSKKNNYLKLFTKARGIFEGTQLRQVSHNHKDEMQLISQAGFDPNKL